jgi:hypothetical protein
MLCVKQSDFSQETKVGFHFRPDSGGHGRRFFSTALLQVDQDGLRARQGKRQGNAPPHAPGSQQAD